MTCGWRAVGLFAEGAEVSSSSFSLPPSSLFRPKRPCPSKRTQPSRPSSRRHAGGSFVPLSTYGRCPIPPARTRRPHTTRGRSVRADCLCDSIDTPPSLTRMSSRSRSESDTSTTTNISRRSCTGISRSGWPCRSGGGQPSGSSVRPSRQSHNVKQRQLHPTDLAILLSSPSFLSYRPTGLQSGSLLSGRRLSPRPWQRQRPRSRLSEGQSSRSEPTSACSRQGTGESTQTVSDRYLHNLHTCRKG